MSIISYFNVKPLTLYYNKVQKIQFINNYYITLDMLQYITMTLHYITIWYNRVYYIMIQYTNIYNKTLHYNRIRFYLPYVGKLTTGAAGDHTPDSSRQVYRQVNTPV